MIFCLSSRSLIVHIDLGWSVVAKPAGFTEPKVKKENGTTCNKKQPGTSNPLVLFQRATAKTFFETTMKWQDRRKKREGECGETKKKRKHKMPQSDKGNERRKNTHNMMCKWMNLKVRYFHWRKWLYDNHIVKTYKNIFQLDNSNFRLENK